jgi:FemAB-related protein (PEP-CTERM system-associated)
VVKGSSVLAESVMTSSAVITAPAIAVRADLPAADCAAYVQSHPAASAYHDPRWLTVFERAFGHRSRYLAAESGGAIVGVLPVVFFNSRLFGRRAVSLPFVNYGGIVADRPEAAASLLDAAVAEARAHGSTHVELRHTEQVFSNLAAKRHKVAMRLPLPVGGDALWAQLDRKVRNQVRKAEKSGLDARIGGAELLPAFYTVFARNMRDLGTPVYSSRFFAEVFAAFPDRARVFVISHQGQPVAASIVHWQGGMIEVPWASALREFNPLCPNVLLYWEMLRFAVEQGFARFDFGRSTPGEGTFHFKRQWGAVPQELVWEYWTEAGHAVPDLSPKNPKFSLAIRAWQRLPVGVATALGPHIVRNIP